MKKYKAQSTLEYAVITAVVVAAFVAMQIYMRRGVEGKLRDSTDSIGDQFEAENTTVTRTTNRTGKTVQEVSGGTTTTFSGVGSGADMKGTAETRTETGTETVSAWQP